jgi:hypothetical protein
MKYFISAAIFAVMFVFTANAQIPIPKTGNAGIGDLTGQFTNAIQPSSFTDQWAGNKEGFLSNAGKVKDAAGVGKSVASLAGFLKPGMFKQGFNVQRLISSAGTIKTMVQAVSLLKNLEGGLKPEAFESGWAQKRTGWLSALNLIK